VTAWLHQLDVWAYQFIAALWGMFWPTFLIVAAFTGVERLFPLEPKLPWRAVRFNLVWQLIVLSISLALSWTAWGHLIGWLVGIAGTPLVFVAKAGAPWVEAWRIVLAIAVLDLMQYWVHRLSHAMPALWVVHRFHHEERHLHAATSLRQHWLNFPIMQLLLLPTAWLWGGDPIPSAAGYAVIAIAAFHHANIRLETGWWGHLVVGPQMHRLHHAPERAVHDKNFAAVFPAWDRLFGTYLAPRKHEFGPTGLADRSPTASYMLALIQPVLDWSNMLLRAINTIRF
jgi:sterol desaturase/sphingolipid hydroxylase (fatty acid hydroxylase superfamily)